MITSVGFKHFSNIREHINCLTSLIFLWFIYCIFLEKLFCQKKTQDKTRPHKNKIKINTSVVACGLSILKFFLQRTKYVDIKLHKKIRVCVYGVARCDFLATVKFIARFASRSVIFCNKPIYNKQRLWNSLPFRVRNTTAYF